MKSIYDVLQSTPVHETTVIRFNRPDLPGHIDEVTVTEEQLRWIQYNIAIGEFPHDGAVIIDADGTQIHFGIDGRLTAPIKGSNVLNYNDNLAMGLFDYFKRF